MHRFEYKLTRRYARFGIYIEITSADKVKELVEYLEEKYPVTDIQVTPPRSGTAGYVGIEAIVHPTRKKPITHQVVSADLEKQDHVVFSLESI
jgi:hypothetical protein